MNEVEEQSGFTPDGDKPMLHCCHGLQARLGDQLMTSCSAAAFIFRVQLKIKDAPHEVLVGEADWALAVKFKDGDPAAAVLI